MLTNGNTDGHVLGLCRSGYKPVKYSLSNDVYVMKYMFLFFSVTDLRHGKCSQYSTHPFILNASSRVSHNGAAARVVFGQSGVNLLFWTSWVEGREENVFVFSWLFPEILLQHTCTHSFAFSHIHEKPVCSHPRRVNPRSIEMSQMFQMFNITFGTFD